MLSRGSRCLPSQSVLFGLLVLSSYGCCRVQVSQPDVTQNGQRGETSVR
jgi:hypothetical protein